MTEPELGAVLLMLMFCLGIPGIALVFEELPRRQKIAAAIWAVFWAGPPLIRLWIAGVLS